MKAGIYVNTLKENAKETTEKLISCFQANGVEYSIVLDDEIKNADFVMPKLDLLFALGGDGTVLRIAKHCALNDIPVIGVNIGTVGFLTEIEPDEIETVVPLLLQNKYDVEKRSMLEFVDNNKTHLALNDVVVGKANDSRLLLLDLYINEEIVDRYYCDGFIVSTPTGSTAYSLSAGGAIISPQTEAFALTPVNSHSLHSRPIVVDNKEIISINPGKITDISVVVDGEVVYLGNAKKIKIKKSDICASFIRLDKHNFYNKLLKKLNKWSVVDL